MQAQGDAIAVELDVPGISLSRTAANEPPKAAVCDRLSWVDSGLSSAW